MATTTGSTITRDGQGTGTSGIEINFRMADPPTDAGSCGFEKFTLTSGVAGALSGPFLQNTWYIGRRGGGKEVPFLTPTTTTFNLPQFPSRAEPL